VVLGIAIENRGRQSWGWTDGKQIVKSTGCWTNNFNDSFFGYPKVAMHTRHATTGGVTDENAHPYDIGGIIGMHNGIVHNHEELNKKYDRKCAVDSQHIFHHIAEGKDLGEISAYGAVTFFKDGELHLGRFNAGDLSLVRTNVAWLFASTKASLHEALRLSGLARENPIFYKLKEGRCYKLVGKELRCVSELKLNFGSYSKSWSTWEGHGNYSPTKGGYRTTDNRRYQGQGVLLSSGGTASKGGSKSGATQETKGTPPKQDGRLDLEAQTTDMVMRAVSQMSGETKVDRPAEPSWRCDMCKDNLAEGEPFYAGELCELYCQQCAARYVENVVGGPFVAQPQEIAKVDALLKPEEKDEGLECDTCNEKLYRGEYFVCTKSSDILCWQCFVTGGGEPDDIPFTDAELAGSDDDPVEVAYYEHMMEKHLAEMGRQKQATSGMRLVPSPEERQPNEAENLKKHGAGYHDGHSHDVNPSQRFLN
jgi:hypothetical protein